LACLPRRRTHPPIQYGEFLTRTAMSVRLLAWTLWEWRWVAGGHRTRHPLSVFALHHGRRTPLGYGICPPTFLPFRSTLRVFRKRFRALSRLRRLHQYRLFGPTSGGQCSQARHRHKKSRFHIRTPARTRFASSCVHKRSHSVKHRSLSGIP
jgi:hypothetical protein